MSTYTDNLIGRTVVAYCGESDDYIDMDVVGVADPDIEAYCPECQTVHYAEYPW